MKVLYWNVYTASKQDEVLRELREMINKFNPEVIGLGEADHMWDAAKNLKNYRVFSIRPTYRGEGDTVALVRDDVNLKRWRWMKMRKHWTGPKHGLPQGPKRYWNGVVKHEGVRYRILIGHWPFNTARQETEDRVVAWFKRALPRTKSVHLGDLNMRADDMTRFVKKFNGKHTGEGIDRAMYKNFEVISHNLGKRGVSDHPAVLFNFSR